MDQRLQPLFTPWKIGNCEIKNRIVLTSMGGILGVACGIGLAEMMSHIMGTPVAISVPACIIAVAFSMVIGVVFGLVPAMKASKLNAERKDRLSPVFFSVCSRRRHSESRKQPPAGGCFFIYCGSSPGATRMILSARS